MGRFCRTRGTLTCRYADTSAIMAFVPATPPNSIKRSLRSRLITRTHECWPDLADLTIRHRGQFVSVDGELRDGATLPHLRLCYGGSANS